MRIEMFHKFDSIFYLENNKINSFCEQCKDVPPFYSTTTKTTDKNIIPEQWFVKQLISKINNKQVIKPQYQRKKKWDISHKSNNNPNERSYIEFLFAKRNSVFVGIYLWLVYYD